MSLFGQPQTLCWRVEGMWEWGGAGSDRPTMMRKRTQGPSRILLNARYVGKYIFSVIRLPLELEPELLFRGCGTRWMSRSWLSETVTICFSSGGLMEIASGFVLSMDYSSTILSFKLLSWEHHRSLYCNTPRTAPGVIIALSVHRSLPRHDLDGRYHRLFIVLGLSSCTANSPKVRNIESILRATVCNVYFRDHSSPSTSVKYEMET